MVSGTSKAILNIVEGDQMVRITSFWAIGFGDTTNCPDLSDTTRSKGSASVLDLFTFLSEHFKQERTSSVTGLWRRVISIGRHFNEEEGSLRRRDQRNRERTVKAMVLGTME
ncbi:hypothetical protein AMTR_s00130p00078370 [Amborella trichopoda]|uniref:Uncharacterized protein n=1 Tax=Amborella trichopoda TaxID=13333 RepID=W1NQF9_AMBTC|nr:hypothetical protein AMTR_s00130p00078370 [Amborella trichopoda]